MVLPHQSENAKTLAALLGTDELDAARLLDIRVLITREPNAVAETIAQSIIALLSRTITEVTERNEGAFAAELVLGAARPRLAGTNVVWLSIDAAGASLGTRVLTNPRLEGVHGALLLLSACYTSALLMKVALSVHLPFEAASAIRLDWQEFFGPNLSFLDAPIELGEVYLAGAGAIGNAFLLALREFSVSGRLVVCDPKTVMPGSLNRCLWFDGLDINKPKAERLCDRAQSAFPKLELSPFHGTLAAARKAHGESYRIERLVVGIDSRRGRRSLQLEFPREVFDASTTDIREIVLHFNRQPSGLACLSCIYPETDREISHHRHVADALGVALEDVFQEFVSEPVAAKICRAYPTLTPEMVIGRAFDSIFKELCGQGALRTAEDRQVLAPFSFVSVLAGTYLAIEFVRRCASDAADNLYTYWRASPWHSPNMALRQRRARLTDCEFCGNTTFQRVNLQLWEGDCRGTNASSPFTILP